MKRFPFASLGAMNFQPATLSLALAAAFVFSGCAAPGLGRPNVVKPANANADATLTPATRISRELVKLPPPKFKVPVAVYAFRDQTGQFKQAPDSNLSNAVTQGAAAFLVKSLLDSGWYLPIEREGFQNLLNERRVARALEVPADKGKPGSSYPALVPAQFILEGGIIGYENNVRTGGIGANLLGIGAETKYRVDQVTVNLRCVDVRTGQVSNSVSVTKTIFSHELSSSVYKFIDYKKLLQGEGGYTSNEPAQLAVKSAIELAVIHLTVQGIASRVWSLRDNADWLSPVVQNYMRESESQYLDEDEAPVAPGSPIPMRPPALVYAPHTPLHLAMPNSATPYVGYAPPAKAPEVAGLPLPAEKLATPVPAAGGAAPSQPVPVSAVVPASAPALAPQAAQVSAISVQPTVVPAVTPVPVLPTATEPIAPASARPTTAIQQPPPAPLSSAAPAAQLAPLAVKPVTARASAIDTPSGTDSKAQIAVQPVATESTAAEKPNSHESSAVPAVMVPSAAPVSRAAQAAPPERTAVEAGVSAENPKLSVPALESPSMKMPQASQVLVVLPLAAEALSVVPVETLLAPPPSRVPDPDTRTPPPKPVSEKVSMMPAVGNDGADELKQAAEDVAKMKRIHLAAQKVALAQAKSVPPLQLAPAVKRPLDALDDGN